MQVNPMALVTLSSKTLQNLYVNLSNFYFICLYHYFKFLFQWKHVNVITLCRKRDIHSTSNYRPISLLSTLGKISERVVFKDLDINYMVEHALYYE